MWLLPLVLTGKLLVVFFKFQCPFAFMDAQEVPTMLFCPCLMFVLQNVYSSSLGLQDSASCFVESMKLGKMHSFKELQEYYYLFLLII